MAKAKGQTASSISPLSSIKAKFASLVIGATLVSCTAVGLLSYEMGKTGLIDASKLRLEAIAQNQAEHVDTYTKRLSQSLSELSTNSAIGEVISNMAYALTFEKDQILSTFEPEGRSLADRAAFEPEKSKLIYAMHHAKVHAGLYSAWKNVNASDIYIIDDKGAIVYSVTKSREFLTNVADPGNEALKSMFDKMVAGGNDDVQTTTFVPFKAEDGPTSIFLGRPVTASEWGEVKRKGYIVFRVSAAKFGPIVADQKVLSQVGNMFLTANDGSFRAGNIKGGKVPAEVASLAKNDKIGASEVSSGSSDDFYSYVPVRIFGQDHMLFAGQPMAEILAPANKLAFSAVLVTLAVVAIMALVGFFVSSRLTRPLIDLTQLMNRLIAGDKGIEIKSANRKDEIGVMAKALDTFRKNALDKDRMEHEAAEQSRMSEEERQEREAEKARSAEELEAAVTALAEALRALSRGELATRIDTPFVPALDQLRQDFNESVERLEETVKAISVSTDAIQAGSSSLKSASENLAQRTERQAASLEEAAAALAEMTESVNSTRTRCETADTVASSALKDTLSSGTVVQDAISAMERIESSSGQIRTIIDVIDQIAFQTNLLALNAGVEAARAGDAGKGFAVVAQEVRELAQKSAAAASDISGIITTSASDVENGVNLVLKTGKSLQTIEQNVKLIHEHIGEIVSATRDQSARLGEINSSVNDLDHVTQQNAAMVEETTAAAHGLDREAGVLTSQVSAFSTSGSRAPRASKAA